MESTPSLWTYNVRRTREWWAGDRDNRRLQAGGVWNENIVVNPLAGRGDPPAFSSRHGADVGLAVLSRLERRGHCQVLDFDWGYTGDR
ncbi:hypothetical protein BDZ89DRAFT_1135487 [Hymenopellis radicata]|nr:hypothetical protein BDZ89DRAFT_1135482 [Hymenopellis radicata]KAF9025322.1 hypothetical protein BDZ89DRAFT_1135487 [Hymenopellis radicata]